MDQGYLEEVNLDGAEDWEMIDSSEISLVPISSENELDLLAVLIDISAPLSTLKTLLSQKLGADLSHCELWLQDIVQLSDETTLSEQCIQGVGLVQVNLELKSVDNVDRINILDVLKPQQEDGLAEEFVPAPAADSLGTISSYAELEDMQQPALPSLNQQDSSSEQSKFEKKQTVQKAPTLNPSCSASPVKVQGVQKPALKMPATQNENITRWVVDANFRKEQERMKIPLDPSLWSHTNVQHWFSWAINQFKLKGVRATDWVDVDGPALCNMTHTEFLQRIPIDSSSKDPNHDLFWTHLELLRKCKFVGVIQKPVPYLQYVTTPLTVKQDSVRTARSLNKDSLQKKMSLEAFTPRSFSVATSGNRAGIAGSNGQVQLWQFLLELLTDKNSRDVISWYGSSGEFKLNNPEMVAQLWGERKNKPHMNYEKLSRALRYYYDGDMICKVSGKRFVYKFVCDLKQLLGYSADELNRLVTECDLKSRVKRAHP